MSDVVKNFFLNLKKTYVFKLALEQGTFNEARAERFMHRHHRMGSMKANGREPKTCLGRVFNYKLCCFNDVHVFIYVDVCPMFVEIKVPYSALFTNLVGWHASTVSFPLSDVILAQLACPLSDIMFCLHSGITNLSLYKHCLCPHL